jgi:hypothetical protein
MTTTLYNTNTNQLIGKFREGWYKVDGVRPQLEDHIVELVVTATEPPEITDEVTQYATSTWEADLVEMQWKQVWTIYTRTDEEVAQYLTEQRNEAIEQVKQTLAEQEAEETYGMCQSTLHILPDGDAYNVANQFEPFNPNGYYYQSQNPDNNNLPDRFYYPPNGKLYKVLQPHNSQPDWLPTTAVSLYVEVAPPGVVPDWVQPTGAHDAYNTGDRVMFEGNEYESLIDANTWSPTAYPAGWLLIE